MHILKFLLRFCGYHKFGGQKITIQEPPPPNSCRICLAGLQPPHAAQVVTPSAWSSSPWLASPTWWVISVAASHSGPASGEKKLDDLNLWEGNYLYDRDSPYLSHCLIEQSIRVTHFFYSTFYR